MAVGLKRGTVLLKPYNKSWNKFFTSEKNELQNILGNLVADIQHIGSTSIIGMKAKPIIDIAVGVKSMKQKDKYIRLLTKAGYIFRPFGNTNTHLLFVKGKESKRTHHIHLMKYNGVIWKHDLFFRDYLTSHPLMAKKYIELKESLAKQFADDRLSYTDAKGDFIKSIFNKHK